MKKYCCTMKVGWEIAITTVLEKTAVDLKGMTWGN